MDSIGAIFEAIMFFLGVWNEHKATREQCETMRGNGYVVYPMTQEEFERVKKCQELREEP